MGSRTIHMNLDIRGFLHAPHSEHVRALEWIKHDDGTPFRSVRALKNAMYDKLAAGWERLPFGDCDDFDPKTGCRGHATETNAPEDAARSAREGE